jgi:membrane protein implicated in regulation of membrane protease activity
VIGFFEGLAYWHWFVLGVGLAAIEVLAPGTFLLWLGIAAGVVGVVLLIVPDLGWEWQLALFAILSVVSVLIGRYVMRRFAAPTDESGLNRRGEQFVGRVFVLAEPIENGRGAIRAGDSLWRVAGPDRPVGTRVRVTGSDGTLLSVEPIESAAS